MRLLFGLSVCLFIFNSFKFTTPARITSYTMFSAGLSSFDILVSHTLLQFLA